MTKTAPIALTLVLVFSILGYVAIDSNSNNTEDSSDDTFTCDDGEVISLDLQNNGIEDCSDSSDEDVICLLYTSPSPRDATLSRMPSSA